MKTFNVRLAAVLLVIAVVFGVGVYFLHGYQVWRNADFFLTRATQAEEEAKAFHDKPDRKAERKAIKNQLDNLRWFFGLAPNDSRTRGRPGTIWIAHVR